ncbi:RNA polymerase sigma factor [Enemella evansiae]|uniref:RNA polymerase sigma factor n=1 Tax=Enemella evansiae TaxID=2016499 RepID=UPI000B972C98|nr:RNA polymerase sigma factor [Enemella evansiae]OYN97109.1 RNA polymerase subunit sigma-70 [Enemella evansiae]OYN97159.1 RNA polymerase subunit sigma-70 [Enemella evansiae]OYO06047.1 RNA polymerase subunit sigma-70 [Enemella evansiae]PFG68760.1 RNA polymerase sigma-70 factor (ECF subfamily) [Propionibacteriaceae bacterium ES.041]
MTGRHRISVDEFVAVFDRHAATIHRYASRRVGGVLADDICSETFLTAFESRNRFDSSRGDVLAWLYGIAAKRLLKHHRGETRRWRAYAETGRQGVVEPREDPRLDAVLAHAELAEVLAALAPMDREVLLLFAWEDLSYAQIAEALDIPVGTVRSRLNRARTQSRAAIGGPETSGATS